MLLFLASPGPPASAIDTATEDALLKMEAVLDMAEFSEGLWPSWDISDTPFALHGPDSTCFLINHPRPPAHFERVREDTPLRMTVYRADARSVPSGQACIVEGVPTAVLDPRELGEEVVPGAFEASFRAHGSDACGDAVEPFELLSGYPIDAWNLVLADIECRLLHRALLAPDDSLAIRMREFASVRRHRRLRMGGRYGEFERRVEFSDGIPAYLAERCRREAEPHLGGRYGERLRDALGRPGAVERCFPEEPGLEWYRGERFKWTGAVLCAAMDRYMPDWKESAARECTGPFEILLAEVRPGLPPARGILDRFGYEALVSSMTTTIEQAKSDAERLFESIARSEAPTISISTRLLSSGEVSFDPTRIERVDEHREVHTGIFRIEYSGGTHFHSMGIPIAVVLGDDRFDIRTLVITAPEEYEVELDGVVMELEEGVYEFMRSLRLTADNLSIEAAAGAVMVGASGLSLILHR
jgi:hypothetical protein